jgi:hypothetical protein
VASSFEHGSLREIKGGEFLEVHLLKKDLFQIASFWCVSIINNVDFI